MWQNSEGIPHFANKSVARKWLQTRLQQGRASYLSGEDRSCVRPIWNAELAANCPPPHLLRWLGTVPSISFR